MYFLAEWVFLKCRDHCKCKYRSVVTAVMDLVSDHSFSRAVDDHWSSLQDLQNMHAVNIYPSKSASSKLYIYDLGFVLQRYI